MVPVVVTVAGGANADRHVEYSIAGLVTALSRRSAWRLAAAPPGHRHPVTVLFLALIIILAAAGGAVGELLELATFVVLSLVLLGAAAGLAVYIGIRKVLTR